LPKGHKLLIIFTTLTLILSFSVSCEQTKRAEVVTEETEEPIEELESDELIEALENLREAMLKKLDSDLDITAQTFTSVKDYWRSKRWADIFKPSLRVIQSTLSLGAKLAKLTDPKIQAEEIDTAFNKAESGLELLSIAMMVQGLQKAGEKLYYGIYGPPYVSAIENMLKSADAVNLPGHFDSNAYKRVIKNHLYGGFEDLPGPLMIFRQSTTIQRKIIEYVKGALQVRKDINQKFNNLISEIEKKELPQSFPTDEVTSQLEYLKMQVVKSMGEGVDVQYKTYLQDEERYVLSDVETKLGAIGDMNRFFSYVAGQLDKKLAIEERVEIIELAKTGADTMLLITFIYKIPGVTDEIRVAQQALLFSEIIIKSYEQSFSSEPEEKFYMLPQEMVFILPTELSNLWTIADDVDCYVRRLLEKETVVNEPEEEAVAEEEVEEEREEVPGEEEIIVGEEVGEMEEDLIKQNTSPNKPTALTQFRSDGKITIGIGNETCESTVIFKAKIEDPDNDKVKLQIELRRLDEYEGKFDETKGGLKESSFVNSGKEASVTVYGLINGSYHWRARTIDNNGNISNWVDFGSNLLLDADFIVYIPEEVEEEEEEEVVEEKEVTEPLLSIETTSLSSGTVGVSYNLSLSASGGKTPYSWSIVSGNLPSGLNLNTSGIISGTPTTKGTYNFTVQVRDSCSPQQADLKELSINIKVGSSAPQAPSSLSATALSQNVIALVWQDNSNDETGFKIERKTGSGGTYKQINTVEAISGMGSGGYYEDSNLTASTTYYYRIIAYNSAGDSAYSNESFATTNAQEVLPTAITDSATNISSNSATLNGRVNPNGIPTGAFFQYGTSTSYEYTTSSQTLGSGTSNINVNANITGLLPNTTYHFRIVATNSSGGTTFGLDQSFKTKTYGKEITVANTSGMGINLRSGPSISYSVITGLPEGTKMYVIDGPVLADGYTWWQITGTAGTGWSAVGEWLTPAPQVNTKVTVSYTGGIGLRLRSTASLSATIIKTLPEGTQMNVFSGPIQADGYTWWALQGYVGSTLYTGWGAVGNWLVPNPRY